MEMNEKAKRVQIVLIYKHTDRLICRINLLHLLLCVDIQYVR